MTTFLLILIAVFLFIFLSKLWIRFVNWFMNPLIKQAEEREKRLSEKYEKENQ